MYFSNPLLKEPEDKARIWRYMDFEKFVSILETSSLFFPCLSCLGEDDPYEGQPPQRLIDKIKFPLQYVTEAYKDQKKRAVSEGISLLKNAHSLLAVSCWHMNSEESAAMWKIYAKSGAGIAISTTFEGFKKSVHKADVTENKRGRFYLIDIAGSLC